MLKSRAFARRPAEHLKDHGDGATLTVEVGDGEGNTLAALMEPKHDEVTRLRRLRDIGRVTSQRKSNWKRPRGERSDTILTSVSTCAVVSTCASFHPNSRSTVAFTR